MKDEKGSVDFKAKRLESTSVHNTEIGSEDNFFKKGTDDKEPKEAVKIEDPKNVEKGNEEGDGFVAQEILSTPFLPINPKWQLDKCRELHLDYVCPLVSGEDKECAGKPVRLEKMKPDGNCFFRSLSYVLTGDQESHKKVRREICSFMLGSKYNKHIKRTLLNDYPSVANYLSSKNMYSDGEWASEVEIYTAALMLKTKIYVFRNVGNRRGWHLHDPALIVKGFFTPSS